jgi:hypothetical protein
MSLSIASVLADLQSVVTEGQKAVPALEALLTVAEKVETLLPADDQAIVKDGVEALTALLDVLAKA